MRSILPKPTTVLAAALLAGCASHAGQPDAAPPPRVATDFTEQRGLVYTPAGWPQALRADVYAPTGAGPFPAVVMVHGGGWSSRDPSDMAATARKLARRGYVVANIAYRLAPAHRYPAALEDVRAAVGWLRAHHRELKVDPRRIGGWGYSAGAHLVALAATADGPEQSRLQAVVAGGTPADLPHYPVSPIITRFIGGTYAEEAAKWIEASPVTHVSRDDPPVFLYHGTWDRLVYADDARTFQRALQGAGVPVETCLVRGAGHITTFLLGFGAEGAALDFLDRRLRAAPG